MLMLMMMMMMMMMMIRVKKLFRQAKRVYASLLFKCEPSHPPTLSEMQIIVPSLPPVRN